jgi:hypothetical protein
MKRSFCGFSPLAWGFFAGIPQPNLICCPEAIRVSQASGATMKTVLTSIGFWALSAATALAAPFCLVTASGGTQCDFYDMPSCRAAAERMRGACVVQQQASPQIQQSDPNGAFWRGYTGATQGGGSPPPTQAPAPQGSSAMATEAWRQFCDQLQSQDLAELDALIPTITDHQDEYQRKFDMYYARSQRCWALVRAGQQ